MHIIFLEVRVMSWCYILICHHTLAALRLPLNVVWKSHMGIMGTEGKKGSESKVKDIVYMDKFSTASTNRNQLVVDQ